MVAALSLFIFTRPNQTKVDEPTTETAQSVIGQIGGGYFNFEVADTHDERVQGLSGRERLPDTDALLFVYDEVDQHCIWMKDMRFSIDILWFDEDHRLIDMKQNVSPDTFPQNFCPEEPARYVVEMSAGVAAKNELAIGSVLDIDQLKL